MVWGVVAEWIRAPNSSSGDSVEAVVTLFSRVWVRIPVVTLVSLSTCVTCVTCVHFRIIFSPPRGKWVPVRAELVLVMD